MGLTKGERAEKRTRWATHGGPTRKTSSGPGRNSSQAGAASTGSPRQARLRSRPQCASRDGGPHGGSSSRRMGRPTRRCASGIGDAATHPPAATRTTHAELLQAVRSA